MLYMPCEGAEDIAICEGIKTSQRMRRHDEGPGARAQRMVKLTALYGLEEPEGMQHRLTQTNMDTVGHFWTVIKTVD